jgi:hypothetical protein
MEHVPKTRSADEEGGDSARKTVQGGGRISSGATEEEDNTADTVWREDEWKDYTTATRLDNGYIEGLVRHQHPRR